MASLTPDQLGLILNSIQTAYIFFALYYLVKRVNLQSTQIKKQSAVSRYEIYERINREYADHLWKAVIDPCLNNIWEPGPAARHSDLESEQKLCKWGAWHKMDENERKCYRYTRMALELFERAFQTSELGPIPLSVQTKWQNTLKIWISTSMFRYVFEDTKERLTTDFIIIVERLRDSHGN